MKIQFLLSANFLISLATFVCKESDWFKDCLLNKCEIERCLEFDLKITREFLKKEKNTAAFSPMCFDVNVLLQCVNNNFGSEFIEKGLKDLKFVLDQLKGMDPERVKIFNCLYEKVEEFRNFDHLRIYFLESEVDKILNDHIELVNKNFGVLISSPFDIDSFKLYDYIYSSMISYKNNWFKKFNEKKSYEDDFYLNKNEKIKRKFMYKHDSYIYEMGEGEVKYDIVVLPLAKDVKSYSGYNFYLVPGDEEEDLVKVWDSFIKSCKGKVENFTKQPRLSQEIKLSIPKIENLKSVFDSRDLLSEVFKYHNIDFDSKMVTNYNVDESGENNLPRLRKPTDSFILETFEMRVDRPYISFIYDFATQRILFVTKDTGVIKK